MTHPPFQKPKITPSFKKKILKDWQSCLTTLTIKPPGALSRRVGPLLISVGFGVARGSEYYEPGFSVHNLAQEMDFLTGILGEPLRSLRSNTPDWLTVRAHDKGDYVEAAGRMKAQARLPLEGPISLSMIVAAYRRYWEQHGSDTIDVIQDPALIAAWAGQDALAKELLEWGYQDFKTWPQESHDKRGGLEGWRKDMEERISNPEKLRQIVEEQVIFHKLTHIPEEPLLID